MNAPKPVYAAKAGQVSRDASRTRAETRDNVFVFVALLAFIVLEVTLPRIGVRRVNIPLAAVILTCTVPSVIIGMQSIRLSAGAFLVATSWVLYFLWCLISFYWSVSSSETILHAAFLLSLLPIAVSASRIDPDITLKWLVRMVAVVCILSWIALFVSPSFALQDKGIWRLKGVMEHEFRLGYLCAIAIIVMAISWLRGGKRVGGGRFWPLLLLFVATLVATQTRTLLAYTLITVLLAVSIQTRGYARFFAISGAVLLVLGALGLADTIAAMFGRGEGDASLSGRTYVWAKTQQLAALKPWKGYGFASYLNPSFDYAWNNYRPANAHSMWINSYFETGLIGSVLLGFAVVSTFLRAVYSSRVSRGRHTYSSYILIFIALSGLTGLVLGGKLTTLYGVSLILFFQEAYRTRVVGRA
ncbi:O-antigen ligase family protein [Phenylobacterium sp. LjRoot219]|uniref:O-antigen ligase family protein n=1 Tax=Phenylobacterium sp. LjRoot219 TaxID=3342283 RepID=UPI003ECE3B4D